MVLCWLFVFVRNTLFIPPSRQPFERGLLHRVYRCRARCQHGGIIAAELDFIIYIIFT